MCFFHSSVFLTFVLNFVATVEIESLGISELPLVGQQKRDWQNLVAHNLYLKVFVFPSTYLSFNLSVNKLT